MSTSNKLLGLKVQPNEARADGGSYIDWWAPVDNPPAEATIMAVWVQNELLMAQVAAPDGRMRRVHLNFMRVL
jgi:hypothetical protein